LKTEYGDELLREKGADPVKFRPGVAYHYVRVPFHVTLESGPMLAQAGKIPNDDMRSDASPEPDRREITPNVFSANVLELQEERMLTIL
jgi:hypothetical protein